MLKLVDSNATTEIGKVRVSRFHRAYIRSGEQSGVEIGILHQSHLVRNNLHSSDRRKGGLKQTAFFGWT